MIKYAAPAAVECADISTGWELFAAARSISCDAPGDGGRSTSRGVHDVRGGPNAPGSHGRIWFEPPLTIARITVWRSEIANVAPLRGLWLSR